jgi:quercetin dioxygenase-like cupin family protein
MPPKRFVTLAAALVLGCATHPLDAAEGVAPTMQGSHVYDWNSLEARATGVGERRDVVDLPTATLERFECHISTLNAGASSHPPHRHPQEEFIIIKEGTLDVFINGESRRVGPGSLFFFASNDWHNVQNVGDGPATYLVFNLATAATRTVPAEGAATTAAPGTLPSAVHDWNALEVVQTKAGERRAVFDSPTVTCANLEAHATTLNGGLAAHAPHRHPDEEIIVVMDGTVEATVSGVTTHVGPGSICFFASNDEHGLKNAGDTRATYFVVRIVTEKTPAK